MGEAAAGAAHSEPVGSYCACHASKPVAGLSQEGKTTGYPQGRCPSPHARTDPRITKGGCGTRKELAQECKQLSSLRSLGQAAANMETCCIASEKHVYNKDPESPSKGRNK